MNNESKSEKQLLEICLPWLQRWHNHILDSLPEIHKNRIATCICEECSNYRKLGDLIDQVTGEIMIDKAKTPPELALKESLSLHRAYHGNDTLQCFHEPVRVDYGCLARTLHQFDILQLAIEQARKDMKEMVEKHQAERDEFQGAGYMNSLKKSVEAEKAAKEEAERLNKRLALQNTIVGEQKTDLAELREDIKKLVLQLKDYPELRLQFQRLKNEFKFSEQERKSLGKSLSESNDLVSKVHDRIEDLESAIRSAIKSLMKDEEEGDGFSEGMAILCKAIGIKPNTPTHVKQVDVRDIVAEIKVPHE